MIRSSTIYRTAQVFHPSYHTFGNGFKPLQAIRNICLIPWWYENLKTPVNINVNDASGD